MLTIIALTLITLSGPVDQAAHAGVRTAKVDTLTLQGAYASASAHFPRRAEVGLQERSLSLRLRNLETVYLPSIGLTGQAIYHSDVAEIPISAPGLQVPGVPHDQYRLGVGVEQVVFDGGLTGLRKEVERAQTASAIQGVEVDAYALRSRIEDAFFGALIAAEEIESLQALVGDLEARARQLDAGLRQGVARQADVDVLQAELVRLKQQIVAVTSRKGAALDALRILTGRELPEATTLIVPRAREATSRPEIKLFDLTRDQLVAQAELAGKQRTPRLQAFGEGAVGRPPGLNLFEDRVQPFFSVGLRVSWPFWDWGSSGRTRQILDQQRAMIDAREQAFLQSVDAAASQAQREIEQYHNLLILDDEVIALRERITADATSRFGNGVITATDYLVERTAEQQARLAKEKHRLQLNHALARLSTIRGKTNPSSL